MTTNVFFFLPGLHGGIRQPESVSPTEPDHGLLRLERAMVLDAAERLATQDGIAVALFEAAGGDVDEGRPVSTVVIRKTQPGVSAGCRVEDAVRSFYGREGGGTLAVVTGRNPLYPPSEILRAASLLGQEDDAVVYAAAAAGEDAPVVLIVTRRFHAELFGAADAGCAATTLRNIVAAEALVVPLRPMRTIDNLADLPWLIHEVEREVLMGHWFPKRTYEILKSMRRNNLIPEPA